MRIRWLAVLSMLSSTVMLTPTKALSEESQEGLYAVRLVSAEIPLTKQKEIKKSFGAGLSETYIYVCILADGNLVWRSKKLKVSGNESKFCWDAGDPNSLAGIFWDTKSEFVIKAFLSDDMTDATLSAGTIGAAGGAGLGALIGGIAAGVFTGGFGAPAGALIGGAIGGAAGGAGGAAYGAVSAEDKVIFEKDCPAQSTFPLTQPAVLTENILGDEISSRISFKMESVQQPLKSGDLLPGKIYLVAVKSARISAKASAKGESKPEKCRYYVKLMNGDSETRVPVEGTFATPPDQDIPLRYYVPLKNQGFETRVEIREEDPALDDTIFTATMGGLQGKNWLFTGKVTSDDLQDSSFVEFQTFGPIR